MSKDIRTTLAFPHELNRFEVGNGKSTCASEWLTTGEILAALEEHFGKPVNICLQNSKPMDSVTHVGEAGVLVHVESEINAANIQLGYADLQGWRDAYKAVFGKEAKYDFIN